MFAVIFVMFFKLFAQEFFFFPNDVIILYQEKYYSNDLQIWKQGKGHNAKTQINKNISYIKRVANISKWSADNKKCSAYPAGRSGLTSCPANTPKPY